MRHPPEIHRARALRQSQSVAEKLMWERLRKNQLRGWGFRRQSPVAGFVVDFLCHDLALILEVDGPTHDNEEQRSFDAQRTKKLEAQGFIVVRVREQVVRDGIEHVLAWLATIGEMRLAGEFIPGVLRRMEKLPLP